MALAKPVDPFFYGNICKVCGSIENIKTCSKCGMVPYCKKEHQTKDWPEHRQVCKILLKALQIYKTHLEDGSTMEDFVMLHGHAGMVYKLNQPCLQDNWYYMEVTSYPRLCMKCFVKAATIFCEKCAGVGYCGKQHMMLDSEMHGKQCEGLKRCREFITMSKKGDHKDFIKHKLTEELDIISMVWRPKFPRTYKGLASIFCDFKSSGSLRDEFIATEIGDTFAPIATIIHVMERIKMVLNRHLVNANPNKPFEIHFPGLGLNDMRYWKYLPWLMKMYIVNIPFLRFVFFQRLLSDEKPHDFFEITSHIYHYEAIVDKLSKPDLIVVFGAHFGEQYRDYFSEGPEPCLFKHKKVPVILTAAGCYVSCAEEITKNILATEGAKVLIPWERNKFHNRMPFQVWSFEEGQVATYFNEYITVLQRE